jgi:hypothetical protein
MRICPGRIIDLVEVMQDTRTRGVVLFVRKATAGAGVSLDYDL